MSKVRIKINEFNTNDVANVWIRLLDENNIISSFRSNPVEIDLDAGVYGIYVTGDSYSSFLKCFTVEDESDFLIDIPIYRLGEMPAPPQSPFENPVIPNGIDENTIKKVKNLSDIKTVKIKNGVYMDYMNEHNYIYTTWIELADKVAAFDLGSHFVIKSCGNNTYKAIGGNRRWA